MLAQNVTSLSPERPSTIAATRGNNQSRTYRITLKEQGRIVYIWENIIAPDALSAINKVATNPLSTQEWVATEVNLSE